VLKGLNDREDLPENRRLDEVRCEKLRQFGCDLWHGN
jgi:hypothetical protein